VFYMATQILTISVLLCLLVFVSSQNSSANISGASGLSLASSCMNAFFSSVPPSFCWKKGADFGVIPTGCPSGYFRLLALCMKNCPAGYSFDGASLCLLNCPSDYTTFPLTCTRWWLPSTIGRGAFFTPSVTNFDSSIPCPTGMYKGGALCYRDCANIGLQNCGIGACSSSTAACIGAIVQMGTSVVLAIVQTVTLVVSFGTEAAVAPEIGAAKTGLSGLISKAGSAIGEALTVVKNIATNAVARSNFIDTVVNKAINLVVGKVETAIVKAVCSQIGNTLLNQTAAKTSAGFNVSSLNPFQGAINACENLNTSNTNAQLNCAQNILTVIAPIDPTGLLSVAAAFMQPVCNV